MLNNLLLDHYFTNGAKIYVNTEILFAQTGRLFTSLGKTYLHTLKT